MRLMRVAAPDISPVDEVVQMVHIIVVAVVMIPFFSRVGGRRRGGERLPAAAQRGDQHRQLRPQQPLRLRALIGRHAINERPWRPRFVRPLSRATLRVPLAHTGGDYTKPTTTTTKNTESSESLTNDNISQAIAGAQVAACGMYVWRGRRRRQTACAPSACCGAADARGRRACRDHV